VAAAPPVGGSGAQWRPPARRDHGDADDDDTDDDEATTTTLTMNLPAWQIMVIQTMRQILWHFEAHDDGDDDDDVRDNDDDDDDGDDDLGESCVFSFARMSKCRLGHTLDVPGAT